jgi:hypothetical protein
MEGRVEAEEIVGSHFPQVRDNLGIKTSEGLLDVAIDNAAVFGMLMKGIRPENRDFALEMIERMEIFLGKRPLLEILQEKLVEATERREFSSRLAEEAFSLERSAWTAASVIQDKLLSLFDYHRIGVFYYDKNCPFIWMDMLELVKDKSWGYFRSSWRNEVGHFYQLGNDQGENLARESTLTHLGVFGRVEVLVAAGGVLVCREVEQIVDAKSQAEKTRERKRVTRRGFLKGAVGLGAAIAAAPIASQLMMKLAYQGSKIEKDADERSGILIDKEIMEAFTFNFKN